MESKTSQEFRVLGVDLHGTLPVGHKEGICLESAKLCGLSVSHWRQAAPYGACLRGRGDAEMYNCSQRRPLLTQTDRQICEKLAGRTGTG